MVFCAAPVFSQEDQYFQPPGFHPRFSLAWDFLARFDRIDHLTTYSAIQRGRFELRPEGDVDLSDRLRVGVRAVFDDGTEPNYDDLAYFDNYHSRGAALERYYVLATPGPFAIRAGAFGMPLLATEMLWDHDVQTPGASVAWQDSTGSLTLAAAGFYGPQRNHDRSRIAAGQAIWRGGDDSRLSWELAAAYWSFDIRNLDGAYVRQNTRGPAEPYRGYATDFHLGDLLLRFHFPLGGLPVLVSLDGIDNFAAPRRKRLAFEGTAAVGSLGTPGRWRAFYTYQYVQRDAVVGAYNTDDWWFHTWYEGHRAGIGVTILPRVYVQLAGMLQRRLDADRWVHRYTLDLVKLF